MTIECVLQGALKLNGDDKKYKITVDGNQIITTVRWMDATLFSPEGISDEIKDFKFTATLNDNNTWTELDQSTSKVKSLKSNGFGMQYSGFKGKEISFEKTISFGKNHGDDNVGIIDATFNSEEYKNPVREYLKQCGYTKAKKGFWATLFGK